MKKDEIFWKNKLDKFSYNILREAGTEMPFSGKYNMFFEEGYYKCKGCGNKLFDSKSKFNSGCGWPSFDKCIDGSIIYKEDKSLRRVRTEILCAECNGHLGHVFDDGPTDTGARYCVNSASLNFNKK
jgi:peptide-methionine (R)-S-oxide reductase